MTHSSDVLGTCSFLVTPSFHLVPVIVARAHILPGQIQVDQLEESAYLNREESYLDQENLREQL